MTWYDDNGRYKPGRKATDGVPRVVQAYSLPRELVDLVADAADRSHNSRSELVRLALLEYSDRLMAMAGR
jgi:hypothetical protein